MENMNVKESLTKDVPMSNILPPPCQVLNQSAEYQVIEKAAQLLKKVEQHWKKSLFQNRLQFSPVSDSLNSSESEHYIEKLAAIKFKDASFRNKPNFPIGDGSQQINRAFRRETSVEQNLLMSYDVVSNYFDLVGTKDAQINSNPGSARARGNDNFPTKCQRCLGKEKAHNDAQKKSLSSLPKQQYVLKQNNYGRRGGLSKSSRGGLSVQVSPRSNDSLPTSRTYASASPLPRCKTNFSCGKAIMSSSNPDLRNINVQEATRPRHQTSARYYQNYCGTDRLNSSYPDYISRAKSHTNEGYHDIVKSSNVSIVNITSKNQEDSIPEVNPRKITSAPDKLIIIQHLPQVDIRPELSKQSGPVINIEAEANVEEEKDLRNNNIGVFNYIHKNAVKRTIVKECRPFSNYHKLSGNNCSEEESFAAQLELRSVAENFVYRLKRNDNPSGLVLMSTLLRLIDEVNELIDLHLSDGGGCEPDPNLPPRMEMVSDLLSDELKTWGAQNPAHYQSLNNIIQHLILDIHFVKNGNFDMKEFAHAITEGNPSSSKKASILKKNRNTTHFDNYGHHKHISLNGESNYERERNDVFTHRSTHSEELSLSDKLLQENALKVQRLEKAYKINHRVRIIQRREEAKKITEAEPKRNYNDLSRNSSISDAPQTDDKADNSPDSNKQHPSLTGTSSNDSHPVVAIISPSQIESEEEEDKTISDRVSAVEDKSVVEEIQDADLDSIPEVAEDSPSKQSEEPKSLGNLSDKPVSDIEDEVEEVLSETSQSPGDKQAAGSDYDEDFEPDVTENPSQSVTASSQNEKEKIRRSSHSHYKGVDEVCQTDSFSVNSGQVKESAKDQVMSNVNDNIYPKVNNLCGESKGVQISCGSKHNLFRRPCQEEFDELINYQTTDSNINSKKEIVQSQDSTSLIKSDKTNLTDDNNFVKVHVRDEKGEIILSYAGARTIVDNKEVPNSTETKCNPKQNTHENIQSQSRPQGISSINNYIESERKVLENLTSHVLKELFDDKIQEILSKYTIRGNLEADSSKKINVPVPSDICFNKEQSTQTLSEPQITSVTSDVNPNLNLNKTQEKEDTNSYELVSPSLKLIDSENFKKGSNFVQPNKEDFVNVNEETIEIDATPKINEDENRCSPDVKLLISMVEEMDSSDIEYCETSLKHLSEEDAKPYGRVNNKNLRLHRFNSDEFLVYPRLNPQPSEIKTLQFGKGEVISEVSQGSRKTEISNENINVSEKTTLRSTGITCNLIDIDRLNPQPENCSNLLKSNLTSSTQTEGVPEIVKPFNSLTNLVDVIEISCSQSSSSASGSYQNKIMSSQNQNEKLPLGVSSSDSLQDKSKNKETLYSKTKIDSGTQVDINGIKSLETEGSSTPHSETKYSPSLCNRPSNRLGYDKENTAFTEQNNEISSTSNAESSSDTSTADSWSRLTSPAKRVFECSTSRPLAWSSSSERTSDDERMFVLNQPFSEDDTLGDLEQLMDYLKNSKSSTYRARIRHCTYHKKT